MAPSKRHCVHDEDREEENQRRIDLIHRESHFNLIKIHLLIYFGDHIHQFGNIPMYSKEYEKLGHKDQIKDLRRSSKKNDEVRQVLHSYAHQHGIRMRILTLESLRHQGANLDTDVLEHLGYKEYRIGPSSPW